jgi:hypothetical protein
MPNRLDVACDAVTNAPEPVHAEVDLLMASLRADQSDVVVLFGALREKLVDALGDRVTVQHKHATRRQPASEGLSLALGEHLLEASLAQGVVTLCDRHVVRGIVLRSDELDLAQWLGVLVTTLRAEADRSDATRRALAQLVIGTD